MEPAQTVAPPPQAHKPWAVVGVVALTFVVTVAIVGLVKLVHKGSNIIGKVSGGVVNCQTFRTQTLQAVAKLSEFTVIERNYSCVAGLDASDRADFLLANDAATDASHVSASVTDGFKQTGWQDMGNLVFSKTATVERHEVEYKATVVLKRTGPTVVSLTFTSSVSATADFAPSKNFPADLTLSADNLRKYALVHPATPSFIPPGYTLGPPQLSGLDKATLPFISTASGGVALTLEFTPAVANQPANTCGGATTRDSHKACDLLGTTASSRQVYVAKFLTADGQKKDVYYDTYAVIGDTAVAFYNSYHHPNAKPQLTTEQILQVFDSLKF